MINSFTLNKEVPDLVYDVENYKYEPIVIISDKLVNDIKDEKINLVKGRLTKISGNKIFV